MKTKYSLLLSLLCVFQTLVQGYLASSHAFDRHLNALDMEECRAQLSFISNNTLLRAKFLDAGYRTPRGILMGNLVDLGNYYQCLAINHNAGEQVISGKYCSISIPLDQDLQWPTLSPKQKIFSIEPGEIEAQMKMSLREYEIQKRVVGILSGDLDKTSEAGTLPGLSLTLALCLPRPCSTQLALDSLMLNTTAIGFSYSENYCRLPNDKPWVTADTVAAVVFGLLGLLTIMSTVYDVRHNVMLKKDPKTANQLYQSFSVYTNAQRLVAYKSTPKTVECLDGIRVISMIWIIVGHTYSSQIRTYLLNPIDALNWLDRPHSIWITAAPFSVDTFFMLSGVLLVYVTAGKFTRTSFLKNLHLFYLHRLLRMFPLLAAACLLQASWFNHMADGPTWPSFQKHVDTCRTMWWSTLLHVQNYVDRGGPICLGHTWYLAVDTQMHILSPLVLFWVFSSRRAAWISLSVALAAILTAATAFNAVMGFTFAVVNAGRLDANTDYMLNYYINTLTRGAPFVVGMLFGYWLFVARENKIRMNKITTSILWCLSLATLATIVYIAYPTQRATWQDGLVRDVFLNSFARPAWAAALGWIVFACANGYGGILNAFLSLSVWKIPSKLSYAMYIFHYPLIQALNATAVHPVYFADSYMLCRFFADLVLTVLIAFIATLLIDSPFSVLIGMALNRKANKQQKPPIPYSTTIESKSKL